jgi:predicted transcriptional regulator YdeE
MEPKIVQSGEIMLAGMVFYGDPFAVGGGWSEGNEIGKLWTRFNAFWDKHQASIRHVADPNVGYEVHIEPEEYAETQNFYVMVGVEISEIEALPMELSVKVLPAGAYALFTLRGSEITSNWPEAIYQKWLPGSGYQERAKFTVERYDGTRFKGMDDPQSELDILVPIVEMDKAGLIEFVRQSRERFHRMVEPLSDAQMTAPGVQGAWSVKDIVAHVVAWEELMVRWLENVARGETPDMPAFDQASIDRLNEQMYLAHRDEPLAQVMAAFDDGRAPVFESIEAVPEENLLAPCRLGWMKDDPLWHLVGANTFWHYPPHMARITAWLKRTKEASE